MNLPGFLNMSQSLQVLPTLFPCVLVHQDSFWPCSQWDLIYSVGSAALKYTLTIDPSSHLPLDSTTLMFHIQFKPSVFSVNLLVPIPHFWCHSPGGHIQKPGNPSFLDGLSSLIFHHMSSWSEVPLASGAISWICFQPSAKPILISIVWNCSRPFTGLSTSSSSQLFRTIFHWGSYSCTSDHVWSTAGKI